MYNQIYEKIKEYKKIVIARHIGVDPDALASQLALKEAIKLTYPDKEVLASGSGSQKFVYIGHLDKVENVDYENTLLIVLDTPDKKRVDVADINNYKYKIKIDHHPFVESFCDIEYINDNSSSTCELIIEFLYETGLKRNKSIMEKLFQGLVSDTNRFMFSNSKASTFKIVGKIIEEYDLDLPTLYEKLYMRPMAEIRLQGYISQNMIITENGVGYIKITEQVLSKFKADASSAGNMVNNFNYIDEVLVWLTISEDTKNNIIKVSIRSRGPIVNDVAEKYNGGGHKLAAGARAVSMDEIDNLIKDLDKRANEFKKSKEDEIL